jgi:hypothetical protein
MGMLPMPPALSKWSVNCSDKLTKLQHPNNWKNLSSTRHLKYLYNVEFLSYHQKGDANYEKCELDCLSNPPIFSPF